MLIDGYMPNYDFNEVHEITIRSKQEEVFEVLNEISLADSWITRSLFFFRGVPITKMKLSEMTKIGFEMLDETENEEVLLGLIGKFWTITGHLQQITSNDYFQNFNKEGFGKVVWSFSLEENGAETFLTTETRIKCLCEKSRKKFGYYWKVIQPFSGIVRMEMLKAVKRNAEKNV